MKIISSNINGTVKIPSSKSYLHRLIILSSLADKPTKIYCTDFGKDIIATIGCVQQLSAKVEVFSDYIIVHPIIKKVDNVTLDVLESGSTLRFMLPVVASLGITATFTGSKSIISRPIKPIVDLLKAHGIDVSSNTLPLTISGKLEQGNYSIDGSLSSQFATGLMLALSKIGNSTLCITNATSVDYLKITEECIKQFAVKVDSKDLYKFGNANIVSPNEIVCEGDWSSACFIIALGAMYGKTTVTNLNINSCQGDKVIVDIIKKMGGNITVLEDKIITEKSDLKGIDFDIKNCPDIATILAVLMASSTGKSTITSVDRLKIKESNRLDNIVDMLTKLGIDVNYSNDSLTIFGGKIEGAKLDGKNDHRVAISSIVALTKTGGEIVGTDCIAKSYPTFLQDYKKVGGLYEI